MAERREVQVTLITSCSVTVPAYCKEVGVLSVIKKIQDNWLEQQYKLAGTAI